jgi:TRAP-type C4-dicarboxylate transport system permease small subunit
MTLAKRSVVKTATLLRRAAMLALVVMMFVTTADIGMRLAINRLILGSVEIVQLAIVAVVFLALPETLLRREQIVVDAIDHVLSERGRQYVRFLGSLVSFVLLCALFVNAIPQAADTLRIGDLSTDLQISLFWYWLPITVGGGASVLATGVVAVDDFHALRRTLRHEATE